ncbi:MYB [Ectocarpus sp. CCAP 1310/34]|nr:MYB [Ectocarpus sp. CCAP 1310/34]
MLTTATSAASASSSNAYHGGIQTLGEHQATNILSQANVTSSGMFSRLCWRSPATTSKQQQQQQQQQQQDSSSSELIDSSSSGGSCLQNPSPAELQQLSVTSCASRETIVRNNNHTARLLFDVHTGSSSSSSSGASCRQQQQEAPQGVTGISGNGVSFVSKTSALHVASATIYPSSAEEAAAAAANDIYDPEALLLEPLLISPRSDRQNTSRSDSGGARAHANSITSTSTISVVCEDLLQDDRIMSQSIGRSGSGSQQLGGGIMGPPWETDDPTSSPRPLVPASPPSQSGVQRHQGEESPPFFIPDQQQATRGGRRPDDCSSSSSATAAGGGNSSSSGGGEWYLDCPPNLRHQHQHQHQHQHFHHHAISAAARPPPTAAKFATAAASVAAEVSKAASAVAPSSFATPGSSSYPPIEHGMRTAGGEGITSFSGGGASGGATSSSSSSGGGDDVYNSSAAPDGSRQQHQLSWPTTGPGQQQQQQHRNSMGGDSAGSSYRRKQQPRFVTREDCVPGSRFPRDGSCSGLVEEGRTAAAAATAGMQQQFMHMFGVDVPPFLRSTTEGGSSSSSSNNVSGWHSAPSSIAAVAAAAMGGGGPSSQHHQPSSSSSAKRPHSQLAVGISISGEGIPSSATATTSASCPLPYTDGSLSSSATAGAGVAPQIAARLTPMMLNAHGHQGPGGKKMKVLGAADGSQGWTNLPHDSGNSSSGATGNGNNNWRDGASAAAAVGVRVTTVPVPDSINDATSGNNNNNNNNNNQPRNGDGGLAASAAAPSSAFSPAEAVAAARAALAAAFPPTTCGTNGGGGAGDNDEESSGVDSSPDWTEKDESEEEPDAAPVRTTSSGRGGGGRGSKKTKTPFMLDPKLWTVVERRAVCTAKQCAYRSEEDHRARRRHYHALCNHVHQNGERKGMRFQHHQLEKVQKHQRAHQNTQTSSIGSSAAKPRSPTTVATAPRNKRVAAASNGQKEQTRAIKDANVEAHSPKDWTPELTKRLRDLVDELGPKWSNIADKMPGKTATACMLHWRVGVNPNHMVKGSGTWTAEEDERLSKLVEVVGMKWSDLAKHIPGRIAKQCRERYLNHLDPSLRKDMPWTEDEEALLMRLCFAKQNQWAEICRQLHGRSYNDVKNRFNLIQRRNKRAQGSPTITTTAPPATPQPAPLPTPAPVPTLKPIRRGRAGAANNNEAIDMKVSLSLKGVRSNSGGGAAYGGPIPRPRGGNMPVNNVAATATTSLASGAMAAGGWGPAAATAAVATATATTSHGGGSSSSSNGVSSATAATSSSLGLMGDELGEFGIDGADSALPGSGFAPGGYWHRMVKEEARVARESDDEGSAKSTVPLPQP